MTTSASVSICPNCNGLNLPLAPACVYCQSRLQPPKVHPSKVVAGILICLSIGIALLASYWVFQDDRQREIQSQRNEGQSLLDSSHNLIQKYVASHDGKLPIFKTADEAQKAIFEGPPEQSPFFLRYASLTWNSELSGRSIMQLTNPSNVWLSHSNQQLERGQVIVLFVDGHHVEATPLELNSIKAHPVNVKP